MYAARRVILGSGVRGNVLGVLYFGLEMTCAIRRGADFKFNPPQQNSSPLPKHPLAQVL